MEVVRRTSSSALLGVYRCVRLTCPSTRHARRSETARVLRTGPTVSLRRVGPRSFPGRLLSISSCQSLVSRQTLQAAVLLFQLFQTMDLGNFHAAVFLVPAIIGLFADTEMTRSLDDRLARKYRLSPPGGDSR